MARRRRAARRPRGLSSLSVSALQAEIRRREKLAGSLQRRRDRLARSLASLDAQVEAMGWSRGRGRRAAAGSRRRPRNELNLVQALRRLLSGHPMSVTSASAAVQRAGYRTTSPNFRTIVNQTLINSGAFRRVSRGTYTAK